MKNAYSITSNQVIIDYSSVYCETPEKLLRSKPFENIISRFLENLTGKGSPVTEYFSQFYDEQNLMLLYKDIVAILRLLTSHRVEEIIEFNEQYAKLLTDPQVMFEFVEGLYDFWRSFERYIVLTAPITKLRTRESIHHAQFIKANETLRQLILRTYRITCENLQENPFRVYRQLPAGAHIGLLIQNIPWKYPEVYKPLTKVSFIRLSLLEPPVIFYPKMNTRSGVFKQMPQNPVEEMNFNPDEWFCYPAKIGKLLALTYFHKSYMSHGASLANLFELADYEEVKDSKPDIVMIFGGQPTEFTDELAFFHHDEVNDIMVGYVVDTDTIDYFGYMKKMLLTMHNVIMINRGLLPVHGAMVSIQLKSKQSANIIIVGDSGAGKSETLEAFRVLAGDYISEMTVIFDDMGSLEKHQMEILGYGTEIGAFLRLDDLQPGYAFEQFDRSIFMNPNRINARVILPVTSYKKIIKGTPVNYFLYANNYEIVGEDNSAIEIFDQVDAALDVFNSGKRLAKGTTTEKGLVESYFANPFGAPQHRAQHEKLARSFMENMFKNRVIVGQIRTQLGIEGFEQNGPQLAAKALFEFMGKSK